MSDQPTDGGVAGRAVVKDYETETEPQRVAFPAAADSRNVVAADAERQSGSRPNSNGKMDQNNGVYHNEKHMVDAEKTQVFFTDKTPEKTLVANSLEDDDSKADDSDTNKSKLKGESIAVEPLKSSKHGWLIRLRLNNLPNRPTVPITYKTDAEYKALRRSKKRYEQYKKSLKAEYQASLRKGDANNSSA